MAAVRSRVADIFDRFFSRKNKVTDRFKTIIGHFRKYRLLFLAVLYDFKYISFFVYCHHMIFRLISLWSRFLVLNLVLK